MLNRIIFIIFAISISTGPASGIERDSIPMVPTIFSTEDSLDIEMLGSAFEDNLDSLVNIWYIENSLAQPLDSLWLPDSMPADYPDSMPADYPDSMPADYPDSMPADYPDSVYIERLERLPYKVELTYNKYVQTSRES